MKDYEYECVKVRVQDGIAWTALNRPEKRNAMSPQLHYEMDDALARRIRDIAEVEVSVVAYGHDGTRHVASTLPASRRTGLAEPRAGRARHSNSPTSTQSPAPARILRRMNASASSNDLRKVDRGIIA